MIWKNRYYKAGVIVYALVILRIAFAVADWNTEALKETSHRQFYRLHSPLTIEEGRMIQKTQLPADQQQSFVLWGSAKDQTVTAKETKRTETVEVIFACGRTDLLLPQSILFEEKDQEGCLVDEKTAETLFGTAKGVGQCIVYEGKSYQVRQVLSDMTPVFVLQDGQKAFLTDVTVYNDGNRTRHQMEVALSAYGIDGSMVDTMLFRELAEMIVYVLPYWILCAGILHILWKSGKSGSIRNIALFNCLFWLLLAGMLLYFWKWYELPEYLIPPAWSDFDYWKAMWKEKSAAWQLLQEVKNEGFFYRWTNEFQKAILSGVVVNILLGFLFRIFLTCYNKSKKCRKNIVQKK